MSTSLINCIFDKKIALLHYGISKKKELTLVEKNKIVKKLALGMTTLQISKQLGRDHRTVKKMAEFWIQPREKEIKVNSKR